MANSDIRTGHPSFNGTRTRRQAQLNCAEIQARTIAENDPLERKLITGLLSTIPVEWYNGKTEYVIQCVQKTLGNQYSVNKAEMGWRSDRINDSFWVAKREFNPNAGTNFGSYWGNGLKLNIWSAVRDEENRDKVNLEAHSEGGNEANGFDIVAFKSKLCVQAPNVQNPSEEIQKAVSYLDGKGLRSDIWTAVEGDGRAQKELARELDMDPATLNRHLQKCRDAIAEYAKSRL